MRTLLHDMLLPNRRRKVPAGQMSFGFEEPAAASYVTAVDSYQGSERPEDEEGTYGKDAKWVVNALLKDKGSAIEGALGVQLGKVLACGATGCVIEAGEGQVLKITPSEEEAEFWNFMHSEQKRKSSPASKGVVHVNEVFTLEVDQGAKMVPYLERYFGVLRDDVAPAFRIVWPVGTLESYMVPTKATEERVGSRAEDVSVREHLDDLAEHSFPRRSWQDALDAQYEYRLGDVHLGNVGWKGNKLVIFDAHVYGGELPEKRYEVNPMMVLHGD